MYREKYLSLHVVILTGLLGLSACGLLGSVTGGGYIPSSDLVMGDKANFGFVAEQCGSSTTATGTFNYHDKDAPNFQPGGVDINGPVVHVVKCVPGSTGCGPCEAFFPTATNLYAMIEEYNSTNPKHPGSGLAVGCAVDNGQGFKAIDDEIAVVVLTGPFQGYTNMGPSEGNIQKQQCP